MSSNDAGTWSKRGSAKKRHRIRTSSGNYMDKNSETTPPMENPLRNRSEIFKYFFTALTDNIILSREILPPPKFNDSDTEVQDYDINITDDLSFKHMTEKTIDMSPTVSIFSYKRKEVTLPFEKYNQIGTTNEHVTDGANDIVNTQLSALNNGSNNAMLLEKIIFKNGNIYEGTCNDYLMHGNGTFTWTDKTVYRGQFNNGYITGKGEMVLSDLSKYEGDFCHGTFHGTGVLNLMATSIFYYGSWNSGKKHGTGWITYDTGDWYEGDWINDLRHGIGYRRYKNGAKYKGHWVDNKKQGKGKILLDNNDYYNGEWYDDKPHGHGEYTWDLIQNEAFCFPLYNSYRGSWKNGERNGVGIMNFGSECGAKYAGTWSENNKHGPGVMICGNGLVLESNPLFEFNKPVHKSSQRDLAGLYDKNPELSTKDCEVEKSSYYEILKMVNSGIAYDEVHVCTLLNITKKGQDIQPFMFVKLLDSISGSRREWCPLEIPTHTIVEEVDFTYFIDTIIDYAFKNARIACFSNAIEEDPVELKPSLTKFKSSMISYKFSIPAIMTPMQSTHSVHLRSTSEPPPKEEVNYFTEENIESTRQQEVELFRNAILIYLPKLRAIYNKYAFFGDSKSIEKDFECKSIMVRLFLWQLFRDSHVQEGAQLAQIDSLLWNNPESCLDTEHYPFEPIYFYQFLQYLMGCAWSMYLKKLEKDPNMQVLLPSKIFRQFLESNVFTRDETFTGSVLGEHLNLVPIKKMYDLYASIGEPMSVQTFLHATYKSEKEKLPCFAAVSSGTVPKIIDGYNVVPMGHELSYVQIPEPIIHERDTNTEKIENPDQFSRSLLTFRTLGKKKLIECLTIVCPLVMKDAKLEMSYNLTFLEFYEVIILCTFLKAEELVKYHESASPMQKISSMERIHLVGESPSRKDKLGRKKKFKKSALGIGTVLNTVKF